MSSRRFLVPRSNAGFRKKNESVSTQMSFTYSSQSASLQNPDWETGHLGMRHEPVFEGMPERDHLRLSQGTNDVDPVQDFGGETGGCTTKFRRGKTAFRVYLLPSSVLPLALRRSETYEKNFRRLRGRTCAHRHAKQKRSLAHPRRRRNFKHHTLPYASSRLLVIRAARDERRRKEQMIDRAASRGPGRRCRLLALSCGRGVSTEKGCRGLGLRCGELRSRSQRGWSRLPLSVRS